MKRGWNSVLLLPALIAALALGTSAVEAQGGKALVAEQIVERHVEALGGAKALTAIETVVMTGIYEFNGEERPLTIVRQRPDRVLIEIDIDGEPYIEAFDGETAWWRSPRGAEQPVAMDEPAGALFREEWSDFDGALIAAETRGYELVLDGQESLDGTSCWKLEVTLPSERKQTWYVGVDDFLLVRKITTQVHPRRGEVPRTWFYEDDEIVSGVRFPNYIEREDRQFVRAYRIESIETNVELAAGRFSMPAADETPAASDGS